MSPHVLRFALPFAALLCCAPASLHAAEVPNRPLQILYVGQIPATPQGERGYAFLPGQRLAPQAIYFDYRTDAASLTADYLKHFDAVVLAGGVPADAAQQAPLAKFSADGRVVTAAGEVLRDDLKLRVEVLRAVGEKARGEWERFIAGREPLKFEPSPEVANYERRPEPLPLQLPLSPRESMKYTQVPADFELKLFASEPDISKPIAMAWDERGRLWIAETRDYPNEVRPEGIGNDAIKICEDTDGDGRADKFTVFADKLNIPTSLIFVRGGIMVAQAPHFLFLKDTDGDDKADVREVVTERSWGVNDTHAGPSNLHWGFDNLIYGAVGYAAYNPPGNRDASFRQGLFRMRSDGSRVEFLHQFSNNTWGFGYNDAGDIFGSTANNGPSFFGGIPATVVPKGHRFMTAKRINTFDRMHPNTPNIRQVDVMGGWTAAAGHMFMNSGALPERLRGKALVTEPTCKLIGIFDVQRDGAGFKSLDGFNLLASSDEWMSPVAAEIGPDGAVWVADWYNFIIQHNPTPSVERGGYRAENGRGGAHENSLRDKTRGRIYRAVWKDGSKTPIQSLAGRSTDEVLNALNSDNQFWRLTAQRLLVDGARKEVTPGLAALVKANDGRVGAIHALWTLHGLANLDRETHRAALVGKDPALRRNAIRALGNDPAAQQLYFETAVIHDPDLTTRLAAFVKLAEFPKSKEIQTLVGQLRREPTNSKDEWLNEATKLLTKVHDVRNYTEGPNLLANPSFEEVGPDGLPVGWTLSKAEGAPRHEMAGGRDAHAGQRSIRFTAPRPEGMDIALTSAVAVKPQTNYRLRVWLRTDLTSGNGADATISELANVATPGSNRRTDGYVEGEAFFNSGERSQVTVECRVRGKASGTVWFDDLSLTEVKFEVEGQQLVGDIKRGEELFQKHPLALCSQCHAVAGKGGNVGPALDGLATRKDPAYITESLLEPNAKLAEGFQGQISPMPPMGLVLKDQELADVKAYLMSLK